MGKRTPADTGNRIAVVIGCSDYASEGLNNLRFAEKDADAIAERLRNPEIGGYSDIYAFNSNSSLRDIEVTIDKVLTATRSNDKVVIYFSGHGIKHPDTGQLFLAVNETDKQAPRHTAIRANGLLEQLEEARASRKCVILDCCYSGAFGRKGAGVEMLDYDEDLEPHEGKGVVVLSSSNEYEESLESERHGHSLFTHYLLEGMDGAADKNEDGVITPTELYNYAYDRVRVEADGEMSPKIPLNKLEGPEFYLVHNQQRKQKTLKKWRNKINTMQEQYHHLQAFEWLDTKIRHFGAQPPPISRELTKLHKQVEKDLCKKWRNYKVRLNSEWGKNQISRDLMERAEEYVNGDPEFMFSNIFQEDPLALDLRQHLLGDISGQALDKRWPRERLQQTISTPEKKTASTDKPDPTPHPLETAKQSVTEIPPIPDKRIPRQTDRETDQSEKPARKPAKLLSGKRLLRWALFIAGIGILVLVMWSSYTPANFDPKQIRFGISARNIAWNQSTAYLLGEFRKELNHALKQKGSIFRLATTEPVAAFENSGEHFDDLAKALDKGEIDLLGELTPREIFRLSQRIDLSPFIGPMHRATEKSLPSPIYKTILFGLADNYPLEPSHRPDKLVDQITDGKRIVLAGKESTSGYWWPRHWILNRLESTATDRPFSEISIVEDDTRKIILKVMCDPDTVAGGALAEFRFSSRIDGDGKLLKDADLRAARDCGAGSDARLRIIQKLEEIPNGAYVLGARVSQEPKLASDLQDVWQQAVNRLYTRADDCANEHAGDCLMLGASTPITGKKIERYLPRDWLPRKLYNYTDGFIEEVFNIEDSNASNRSRTIYYLLIVCAVILAIGLTAATLLRKNLSSES